LHEQLPQLGGATDLKLATFGSDKERPKDRLHDIVTIDSPSDPLTQVLLGQSSELFGVLHEHNICRRLVPGTDSRNEMIRNAVGFLSQINLGNERAVNTVDAKGNSSAKCVRELKTKRT
jgi:hypothetical protein